MFNCEAPFLSDIYSLFSYLMGMLEIFNEKVEELMVLLMDKANGKSEVDLMNLFERLTLDIIAKVLNGWMSFRFN